MEAQVPISGVTAGCGTRFGQALRRPGARLAALASPGCCHQAGAARPQLPGWQLRQELAHAPSAGLAERRRDLSCATNLVPLHTSRPVPDWLRWPVPGSFTST